ncbi:MAG: hypothetical protein R3C30_09055 [Hyphomonadaceae bacterium]
MGALIAQLGLTPVSSFAALAQANAASGALGARDDVPAPHHVAAAFAGAITNLRPLRKHMVASGWVASDADGGAVVARLIDFHLRKGKPPVDAVRAALQKLQGRFAVGAISPEDPATIYVAAKGANALVGFIDGAACAVSDAGMRPPGAELTPLEPDDVAILSPARIVVADLEGMQIVKQPAAALVEVSLQTAAP